MKKRHSPFIALTLFSCLFTVGICIAFYRGQGDIAGAVIAGLPLFVLVIGCFKNV